MTIQVESIAKKTNEKQTYFTFTLTLVFEDFGTVQTHGWRYFPSTGSIAAPARKTGARYTPTVWLGGFLYEQVEEDVQKYFVRLGLCEEPFESPEQRKETIEGLKRKK